MWGGNVMENEILVKILAELQGLSTRQNTMSEKLESIDSRQNMIAEELAAFQEFTLEKFDRLEKRFDRWENEQRKTNLIIENEIKPSIQALAEVHVQMQTQLKRIEDKVMSHEEVIFRRVK